MSLHTERKDLKVIYTFPLRLGVSGVGETALNQIKSIVADVKEIKVFCASNNSNHLFSGNIRSTLSYGRFRLPLRFFGVRFATRLHDISVALYIINYFRKRSAVGWIVHGWARGSEITFRVAKKRGITCLLERQNTHLEFARKRITQEYHKLGLEIPASRFWVGRNAVYRRELREYSLADGLLCPSNFVRDSFIKEKVEDRKIYRHQYGYDKNVFYRENTVSSSERLQLIFIGKGEPRKGLHYALEAWSKSRASQDGRFLILGIIEKNYREKIMKYLNLSSVVEVGYTNHVARYLNKSHALVLPSIEEGSALVTYEAMACGCTLLVSDATGAPVRHNAQALVHKAGQVDKLREHMDRLFEDRTELERLRNAGVVRAKSLTWKNSGRILLQCYQKSLIKSSERTASVID